VTESRWSGYGDHVTNAPHPSPFPGGEMSPPDDRSQEPWTDPQTHLDTDPVNAEDSPADVGDDLADDAEEDRS
jgi:hypothetical protein